MEGDASGEASEKTGENTNLPADTAEHVVKKNNSGGVFVGEREISLAFSFLDARGKGSIDRATIQERVSLFPNAGDHGLQELRGLDTELTQKSLSKLLKNNKVCDFDPVAEAFQIFDPKGEGRVDISVLREIFRGLGMGELTTDELGLIRKNCGDPSGFITLTQFRAMLS